MYPESGFPRAFAALGAHRFLMKAALASCMAFAWVFAFQLFLVETGSPAFALAQTALLYAISQVVISLVVPLSARMLRHGVRRMVRWGTLFAATALVLWGGALSGYFGVSLSLGVVGFAFFFGLYRAFYWVPYAVERAEYPRRGRANVPHEIFVALMPAIAGAALMQDPTAPIALLFGAASVLLVALLPLVHVPESREAYAWGYRETFGELLEPRYRHFVREACLDGALGTALLLIWPLAVFMIVGGSYTMLGLVLTITLLLAIPLQRIGERFLPRMPAVHAALAASSWLLRLVVATPAGLVIVDSYGSLGTPRALADRYAHEQGADNATYVDELTALKEIALSLGRLAMCVFVAVLALIFTLPISLAVTFIVAALVSMYTVYNNRQGRVF